MLCDECKKNQAVMHYVSIVNGVKTEHDLCESCASHMGMMSFSPFTWGDLFPHAIQSQSAQIHCSQCGTTLSQFKKTGMLGCSQCYEDMRAGIEPLLRQVQKGLVHVGRTPMGFEAAKLPRPGETTAEAPIVSQEDEWNLQMHKAIVEENFEEAARLRDAIKALRKAGAKEESL